MIKINTNYINRFIKGYHEYLYPVSKGIYLAFDDKTFEYIGVEMYYLPYKSVDKYCDDKLNDLIAKNFLEVD